MTDLQGSEIRSWSGRSKGLKPPKKQGFYGAKPIVQPITPLSQLDIDIEAVCRLAR